MMSFQTVKGLSPRVRGNPGWCAGRNGLRGSIPACAGEPFRDRASEPLPEVYPRVCGGTRFIGPRVDLHKGLSPRVRGNPSSSSPIHPTGRSIPACAGEPAAGARGRPCRAVYPRVCGGTSCAGGGSARPAGLSPRVRGNHSVCLDCARALRSIPACAGEPRWQQGRHTPVTVYPRVCGGTFSRTSNPFMTPGLSPRVRGNHQRWATLERVCASIPACAGEPPWKWTPAPPARVYPRVCGGTNRSPSRTLWEYGLSPRVRGNQAHDEHHAPELRSIPACAGEPSAAGMVS